ncbi:hypothetical protein Dcar01_03534 [Deinococcus carri]|uniref:HK97 gp10 family phage protein n=1 Tax=Deinococcus carri TaxID=1211323 RepID=A0ABP9WDX7_9DEIO
MPWADNPDLDREMDALFDRADEAMAEAAAGFLREVLDQPGAGVKWPGLPNPSSAPGAYPARQSGDLLKSIGAQKVGQEWHFGSFNAPPEAWALEYPSPPDSPITRQSAHGARPWLSKFLGDELGHKVVWDALDSILGR